MKQTLLISWITVRELIHERVLYLLVVFAGASLIIALLLGQITYAEQIKLSVDFMLAAMEISMVLFSIFMGTSLFHREMLLGTVAMVLSKPIRRSQFLIGKFLGQCVIQWGVVSAMGLLAALITLRFETSNYIAPILQTTFMVGLETTLIASVVYFFAANTGELLTAVGSLCVFVLGHLQEAFPTRGPLRVLGLVFKSVVPNLDILNTKPLASYGLLADFTIVAIAIAYTTVCVLFFLTCSILIFDRKDILT